MIKNFTMGILTYLIIISLFVALLLTGLKLVHGQEVGIVRIDVDNDAPFVTVLKQNNELLAVAAEDNLDINSWQVATIVVSGDVSSSIIHCGADEYLDKYGDKSADNYRQDVGGVEQDTWYCFKVSDVSGNIGYGDYLITVTVSSEETTVDYEEADDTTLAEEDLMDATIEDFELEISITETEDGSLKAILVDQNSKEVSVDKWLLTVIVDPNKCNSLNDSVFQRRHVVFESNTISSFANTINQRVLCFRATIMSDGDTLNYYGHKIIKSTASNNEAVAEDSNTAQASDLQELSTSSQPAENSNPEPIVDSSSDDNMQQQDAEGESTVEDNNFRQIGIGITALGVLSIIIVVFISRKDKSNREFEGDFDEFDDDKEEDDDEDNDDDNDDENEEAKEKK